MFSLPKVSKAGIKEMAIAIGVVLAIALGFILGFSSQHKKIDYWRNIAWDNRAEADNTEAVLEKTSRARNDIEAELKKAQEALAAKEEELKVANQLKESAEQQFREMVWQRDLELATVRKGEGICHSLIRQLMADPEYFGFKGDAADRKAVKEWAQTTADDIACLAGYINRKAGKEIRVAIADKVSYPLVKDEEGNLSVMEYLRGDDGNFPDAPGQTNPLVEKIELAQLGEAQSYEYVATLRI